jgi:hypothetical protein
VSEMLVLVDFKILTLARREKKSLERVERDLE